MKSFLQRMHAADLKIRYLPIEVHDPYPGEIDEWRKLQ